MRDGYGDNRQGYDLVCCALGGVGSGECRSWGHLGKVQFDTEALLVETGINGQH